jgi:hypothetical protein
VLKCIGSGKASLPNYVVPISPMRGKLMGALKWLVSFYVFSYDSTFYPKMNIEFLEMAILSHSVFLNL